MSIPINHHFVSQCHQKEFFNTGTGKIYLYDKELNNFYYKKSTKNVFSKDYSNTREYKEELDHSTLENELKLLFEDNFSKHLEKVKFFIDKQINIQEIYENLCWLTFIGILGEFRHPQYKSHVDERLMGLEANILVGKENFSIEVIKNHLDQTQRFYHVNSVSYISAGLRILEKLEPLDFVIYSIESSDHFLLPDTSCFQLRGQLENYTNPFVEEIIQIGIPLSDKIYILATPKKFKTNLHAINFIDEDNSETVFDINKDLYHFSKKAIACKDENYLNKTIKRIKNGCT